MENSHTGAQSVTRDDEEDVSKKQEEDEEVDETAELAGVENDEDESAGGNINGRFGLIWNHNCHEEAIIINMHSISSIE